jgi:hypothetical protein
MREFFKFSYSICEECVANTNALHQHGQQYGQPIAGGTHIVTNVC